MNMNTNNIIEELEQVAPNVARLRKMNMNNKSVPENYFDEVEESIFSQVTMERALFKDNLESDYFKKVEKIMYDEVKPSRSTMLSNKIWLRYAASFVGLILFSIGLWKTNYFFSTPNSDNQYSNVSLDIFVDELSDKEVDNLYSLLNYNSNLQDPLDFNALIDGDLELILK